MIITHSRPADALERPKLHMLEDAAADLDTSATFSRAAERQLGLVREYLRLLKPPIDRDLREELGDLETLLCEAQSKADEARRTILAFHEGEFAARSAARESEVPNGE